MYEEWQKGVPKSYLEEKYLKKTESHGKLFSNGVRRHLGIETEKQHPLVQENARLRNLLKKHGIDPDSE